MGLAVLPARLKDELALVSEVLTGVKKPQELPEFMEQHTPWINGLIKKYGTELNESTALEAIKQEVSNKFSEVLECSGVFKMTPQGQAAFDKFIISLGCK